MTRWRHLLNHLTFKRRLMIFSLFLSVTPVIIVGLSSAYLASRNVQEEINQNHFSTLKQVHYQINHLLKGLHMTSISLVSNPIIEKAVKAGHSVDHLSQTLEMVEVFRREKSFSTIKFNASLIYVEDRYVHSDLLESNELTYMRFMDLVKQNKPAYNTPITVTTEAFNQKPTLMMLRPIPITTNYTDGILVMMVDMDDITKMLEAMPLGRKGRVFVVAQDGTVIMSNDKQDMNTRLANLNVSATQAVKQDIGTLPTYSMHGTEYSVSFQKSNFNDWTYVVMTPLSELTGRSEHIKRLTLLMVVLIVAIWSFIAWFGSRKMYLPIGYLVQKFLPNHHKQSGEPDGIQALDLFMHRMLDSKRELEQTLYVQSADLRQNFIHQVLLGESSIHEIREKNERYDWGLAEQWFAVCIVAIDDDTAFRHTYKENDRTLIHYAIRKMTEEICSEHWDVWTGTLQPGQVAVIIGLENEKQVTDSSFVKQLNQIRFHIKKYFPFTATIAVSRARHGYPSVHTSYIQAIELLRNRLTMGYDVTIVEDRVEPTIQKISHMIVTEQKKMVELLNQGDLEAAKDELTRLVRGMPQHLKSTDAIIGAFSYLLGELEYMLNKHGYQLNELLEEDPYKQLSTHSTLNEIEHWIGTKVFPAVHSELSKQHVSKQAKIIQQVLQFVEEQYDTDLSLQMVADQFQLSTSHLSRMFKEEVGQSFSDYLLECRMKIAQQWLTHTSMPIKEIAEKLRYTSVTNFNRAFKQYASMPPGQFRKQMLSD